MTEPMPQSTAPAVVPVADEAVRASIPESQKLRVVTAVAVVMMAIATFMNTWIATRAAVRVEEVKKTLQSQTVAVAVETTERLRLFAIMARELADATGKPEHAKAADDAERAYRSYVAEREKAEHSERGD